MVESLGLIERSDLIADICSTLRLRTPPAVLLTGDAGIGKSRVLHAVAVEAARSGAIVLHAVGLAGQSALPLAAVADFMPEGLPTATPRGIWSLRHALVARSRGRPTLVCVDDVGLVDRASADLLTQLATESQFRMLMTMRTHAPGDGIVRRIGRPRGLSVERVGPLTRHGTVTLANQVIGGPLDGMSAERVWQLSEGNPLFIRHLLDLAAENGTLVEYDGLWGWQSTPGSGAALRDVVGEVLDSLGSDAINALEVVALGEPVPLPILRRVVAAQTLDGLEARGLLNVDRQAQVRIGHPLYGEAIRANIGVLRSRRLVRQLAAASGWEERSGHTLRVTSWRLEAGIEIPAAEAERAAREALDRCDPALAERLARAASPGPPLGELCRALVAQNKVDEVEIELARADAAGSPDPWRTAIRVLNLFWGLRQPGRAREVLDDHPGDAPENPELRVARAALAVFGPTSEIQTDLLVGASPGCPILASVERALRAYALTFAGRPQQVVDGFAVGDLAPPALWPTMAGASAACHLHALLLSGRLRQAAELGSQYYDAALAQGDHAQVATVCLERGVAATWAGDHATAHRWLAEARALAGRKLPFPIQAYIDAEYAAAAAAVGHFKDAETALATAGQDVPPTAGLVDHVEMARLRILASGGRIATAVRESEPLVQRYLARSLTTNAAELLHYVARLRPTRQTANRLHRVVASCDGALLPILAVHADALASRDAAALARVSERFAVLGFCGLAQEATLAAVTARAPRAVDELTWREREVCELAADGTESRVVAERLGVSVRTVDNQLHRAYAKLDVSGRRQLSDALGLLGTPPVPRKPARSE